MAKKVIKTTAKKVIWEFPLKAGNFKLFAIAIGVIVLGYLLMATGITEDPATIDGKWNNVWAVRVAPMLLVIGYFVLIPFALLKQFGNKQTEN
ncbi:MAG: DUF3098 domain-containing protein [Desulfobulbaceae bacterium]|nr:DUF3098 domain-containing protein [Candidatus Kapabacteria bacterium]MBS3999141.1 DUF3098 domain-containing protein [Desulfobulbaceae bacterium]